MTGRRYALYTLAIALASAAALVLGLLMLTAFMFTFEGVLEYQNPDKFANACPH